ncbi:hypothetical protein NC796_10620 [Aliifodinibius sp. S!AR15-10]|nr:hypothetical protein [Aliifodinibius sp. S!AR15-10]MDR8391596.1 hypothetical protein [Aliifodinibius sp. S!AR15-10]
MTSIDRKHFIKQLGLAGAGAIAAGTGLFGSANAEKNVRIKMLDRIGLQL